MIEAGFPIASPGDFEAVREIARAHDATAAQFVVTALLLLLSLIVIEPATTGAALS